MLQSSLTDLINTLDDATARRVLVTFARAQSNPPETSLTPELRQALREFAPDREAAAASSSEGELARAALLLLADDPQHQPILAALIEGPAPAKFGLLETAAVISAVLIVLQTHVKFERDKEGRCHFTIEKKPTDASLLKSLMQKLLGLRAG